MGLEEEMCRLRRDKSILVAEVVKLRQEQQSTRAGVRAMEARLQHAEQKQVQMMGFLARAMQNPDFFQHLAQHQERRRGELEDAFSKKRRRPIGSSSPEALLFRPGGGFEELGGEPGTSELENLALNIQGLGRRKQQDEEEMSHHQEVVAAAELTDDFWEELLNEGMTRGGGAETVAPAMRRRPGRAPVVDALAPELMSSICNMSNRTAK